MESTLTVTFDGSVLKPEKPLNLELNKRYVITILAEESATGNVWDLLENLAGTIEAPTDWAVEHDHYLYGTPKHQSKTDL
jgi:hypothetical protein